MALTKRDECSLEHASVSLALDGGKHNGVTVAFPQGENLSDNLACGPNISCLSQSGARGPPNAHSSTRQWSMPNVSGQRSTISCHWSVSVR